MDHLGNQVLGVPQMHLGMDAEQLRQLGYDPEVIQVRPPDQKCRPSYLTWYLLRTLC